jgi:PAS domain-containing protein
MFSPSQLDAALYEEVSSVLNAVHRAAFDDAEPAQGVPDPLLAVPVRLIPLVRTTRSLRLELRAQIARSDLLVSVLEALPEAVAVIDGARNVLFANARARRIATRGESARFRFADARADGELEAALIAAGHVPPGGPVPIRTTSFRLLRVARDEPAFLLVFRAS